jgi:hypothetical protein
MPSFLSLSGYFIVFVFGFCFLRHNFPFARVFWPFCPGSGFFGCLEYHQTVSSDTVAF